MLIPRLEVAAVLHLVVEVEQNQEHLVGPAAAGQLEPQHSIADSIERICIHNQYPQGTTPD